jgi:nucleotide-binding universal stress UspA family protein
MARRLAMKAPCSLWLVPEGSARPIRRVFTAVDFSGPSAHALTMATRVASRARASACVALHVREPGTFAADANVDAIARASDAQAFRRFLAPIDLHNVPVDVRTIESGAVAATIERVAREEGADLVVAGTRGRTPSSTILLGSESEQLLSELPSPLLVTRPRGERPGLLEALLDQAFTTVSPRAS